VAPKKLPDGVFVASSPFNIMMKIAEKTRLEHKHLEDAFNEATE